MMPVLGRRRLLTILGAGSAALLPLPGRALEGAPRAAWEGVALGARARIFLAGSGSARALARCRAEIERLERIFSLRRADSALARLNATGRLPSPPAEILEVLSLARSISHQTEGAFDPTVQPLWALHARHFARAGADPRGPAERDVAQARARTGWELVDFSPRAVRLARPGAALTLNGIAQGYIADRLTALLRDAGLGRLLVETGEFRALGTASDGRPWPVVLGGGRRLPLTDGALAVSEPLGTRFSDHSGHILDPRTGRPGGAAWQRVAVQAPGAALADGLSTALCLLPERQARRVRAVWPEVQVWHMAAAAGGSG